MANSAVLEKASYVARLGVIQWKELFIENEAEV